MLNPTDWLQNVTGPNARSGSVDIGRQPNWSFDPSTFRIVSDPLNQQNIIYSFASGDNNAAYVVTSTTASLPNASLLIAGEGISVSGATITVDVKAGVGISLASGSGNQIVITNTGLAGVWTDGGTKAYTTSSISIDSLGRYASQLGSDVFFFVSGSAAQSTGPTDPNRHIALFGGRVHASGSFRAELGFTGSHTTTDGTTSFIAGGSNISVVTQSNGQLVIASTFAVGGDLYTTGANQAVGEITGPSSGSALPILANGTTYTPTQQTGSRVDNPLPSSTLTTGGNSLTASVGSFSAYSVPTGKAVRVDIIVVGDAPTSASAGPDYYTNTATAVFLNTTGTLAQVGITLVGSPVTSSNFVTWGPPGFTVSASSFIPTVTGPQSNRTVNWLVYPSVIYFP